jgi:outer membrane protein assembly factor BamE (lipoprotein component of BamABCDE complex)
MKRLAILAILLPCVFGCATTANRMNKLSVGMTKQQVISEIGQPTHTSGTDGVEYMNYQFASNKDDAFYNLTRPYFVELRDVKVVAFGRNGDFGVNPPAAK